jgi:hypothetical protein
MFDFRNLQNSGEAPNRHSQSLVYINDSNILLSNSDMEDSRDLRNA